MGEGVTPAVRAKGLYHIYREREVETVALRGAELILEQASWTSLMGPSGSGKSTLLHVVAGLLEPSGGSVVIGGEDLTRLPPTERARRRRRHIGVVLQRDNLHPLLDVAGNVALPLRLDGRPRRQVRERVRHLLGEVGLLERRRHRSSQLSGGEAQRWPSPSPSRRGPGCCSPTSRPGSSTRRPPRRSSTCWRRCAPRRARRSSR